MSARALIDTSALLALASPRDQFHGRASAIARRFLKAGGRWVGTTLVLGEFHGHALQRTGPAQARSLIAALLRDPAYEWRGVTPEMVGDAVSAWLERYHDQRFSLTDAVSFELMRRENVEQAFAFDRDFVTAGFALIAP